MRKPEALDAELERAGPAGVYLLAGPAEYLIERFVRRVVEVSQARRIGVEAAEAGPDEVAAEHLVADLFGTPRVVHVQRAEAWPAPRRKKFVEAAAAGLPPGVRVVVTMDAKRPSNAKLPEAVRAAFYWNPFPSALPRLAEGFIRDHGGKPVRGVGEALVDRYGADLRRIDQEAFKVAVGAKKADAAAVARLCVAADQTLGYKVAEDLTSRRRGRALAGVEELMKNESPHGLISMVASRLRRMTWLHELFGRDPGAARRATDAAEELAEAEARAAKGGFGLKAPRRRALEGEVGELLEALTADEKADFGDVFPRALPSLVHHARAYGPGELREALRAVAAADRKLKGEAADERWVVTELAMALSRGGRR